MFHLLQDFLVAAESPDLHGFEVGPRIPQIPSSLATLALAALANMLATLGKDEDPRVRFPCATLLDWLAVYMERGCDLKRTERA